MDIKVSHPWPSKHNEAIAIQKRLCGEVRLTSLSDTVGLVAGVDIAFDQENDTLFAGVSVLSFPDLIPREWTFATGKAEFPYTPGLQVFREGPVIIKALERLINRPDIIIFSGQGIAHPRRFGLASHLGVLLDIPSIGCARKCLAGEHGDVGPKRGDQSLLFWGNDPVGLGYRSREKVKPIYISPGHLCDIESARWVIERCLDGYRMPEPLRSAQWLANRKKRDLQKSP